MNGAIGRRKFDREFKERAVKLVVDGGRSTNLVARELGISMNMLHRWKREYLKDRDYSFPGKGYLRPDDEEMRRLKRELADVKEERDILKKAVAFFVKHPD